jgi:hypothetical protein
VRLNSRTLSCASRRRTASLSAEALPPLARAPSRNPPACATAIKALRSAQSDLIVLSTVQVVRIMPTYPANYQAVSWPLLREVSMIHIRQSGAYFFGSCKCHIRPEGLDQ